jgi:PAS domain S-box-containing protein
MNQKRSSVVWLQNMALPAGTSGDSLTTAEENFTKLFAASSDALLICRQADGYILDVNEAFVHLLGYSHAELRGRTLSELHLSIHPEHWQRIHREIAARGSVRNCELAVRTKFSSLRQVTWTVDTVVLQGESCWLIILHPIDAHKQPAGGDYLNEERIRSLVEIMPAAMFMCDREGLITYYNQRAAELWGRNPKLLDPRDRFCGSYRIYRPNGELLPHSECPMAVAVLTGRGTRNQEIQIERPDGTTILASVNVDPLYGEDGHPNGAINVFEDITQRKQAEERLQAIYQLSEAVNRAEAVEQIYEQAFGALERILHADRASVLLLDGQGVMRFQAWHGLSAAYRQAVEGHPPPWSLHEEQPQPVPIPSVAQADLDPVQEKILQEGIAALAFIPLVESGRLLGKLMLYYNQPHLFPAADVQWAQSVARKVAYAIQRKQAEAALRASEEKFAKVFHASPLVLTITRLSDGRFVDINETFTEMTGYSREEVIGRTPVELGLWVEPARRTAGLAQLRAGHFSHNTEEQFRMKDGSERTCLISAELLELGGETCAVTVINDITERKRAEAALYELNATLEQRVTERTAELQRSNRELDQFAYIASHDLRSPLRAIDTLASWISQDAADVLPEASQVHLAKLRGRIKRMDALLSDLLDYSRAGRHHHSPERVDTGALIRNVLELLPMPVGFKVNTAGPLPDMIAERVPLETVFRNLIGNAIKHHHHPTGGRVDISARELENFVQFTVADNGPGIDPVYHERIFEVFQTLKPRDQVEGSGNGLAIVKRLVESRGGTIAVDSRLGAGASFLFTWPRTAA